MKSRLGIDWITATRINVTPPKSPAAARIIAREVVSQATGIDGLNLDPVSANRFYSYAFEHKLSGLRISISELNTQGVMLVFSGRTLNYFPSKMALLDNLIEYGFKITRIDFAMDMLDLDVDAGASIDEQYRGLSKSNKRRITTHQSNGQMTGLNIGSRQSEFYMRIYDKGIEQGVVANWLRCEIEIKGTASHPYALAYSAKGSSSYLVKMLEMTDGQDTLIRDIMSANVLDESPYETITLERGKSNTSGWLHTQVFPALVKYAVDDPMSFQGFLSALDTAVKMRLTGLD